MAGQRRFSLRNLSARLLLSSLLVFGTYNPSGYSMLHWLLNPRGGWLSLRIVAVLAVTIATYAIFRITFAAFRRTGLIAASLAALVFSLDLIDTAFPTIANSVWISYLLLIQYAFLISLVIVLAFGMSWSYVIDRLTGQQQKRYVQ